jgi:hypothetical protein
MSDFTAETSSEKLVLLLDGELSPTQEVPLYADLAGNDELRSELRELISIKNTVKNDHDAFLPPLAVTSGVFNSLGYSIPGLMGSIGSILLKYSWIPIFLMGFVVLGTYYITEMSFEQKIITANNENSLLKSQIQSAKNNLSELTNSNLALKEQLNKQPQTIVKYIRVPAIQSIVTDNQPTTDNSKAVTSNDESIAMLSYSRNEMPGRAIEQPLMVTNQNHIARSNMIQGIPYRSMSDNVRIKEDVYYLTFNGISALAYPTVNAPTSTASFTNFALGFYFLSPYKGIIIGGEFGKEPYSQRFINTENNKRFVYEQQPNSWWAGISAIGTLNYKIEELFGAQPYGKVFVGATELGPLGKAGAGFKWISTSSGLGAFLGVEGSVMGYQNQGSWYTSGKIGITYGLSIQF